jgi:hypothetical protein
MNAPSEFDTHQVDNQPPPFEPRCLWESDPALRQAVAREGGDWAGDALARYGTLAGGELFAAGFEANIHKPRLLTHDRFGHRSIAWSSTRPITSSWRQGSSTGCPTSPGGTSDAGHWWRGRR